MSDPNTTGSVGATEPYDSIPTYSAEEERQDGKLWRTVIIGEQEHRINMKIIEPYMRVVSHGGEFFLSVYWDRQMWILTYSKLSLEIGYYCSNLKSTYIVHVIQYTKQFLLTSYLK